MCFVFFKQKTAYEVRISDWSSDVCSSDLPNWYVVGSEGHRSRRRTTGTPDRGAAEVFLANFILEISSPRDAEPEQITVAGILQSYYDDHAAKQIGRASCRERVCQYV